MRRSLAVRLAAVAAVALTPAAAHAISFVNALAIENGTDRSGFNGVGNNRAGGFGSDLIYDAGSGLYYGLTDRGPGGGVLSYAPRIQVFTLETNAATGAIGNFALQDTIVFRRPNGDTFNGLNPRGLNGDPSVLGNSLDSEGMVKLANGNFLISDEYGPSLYEFTGTGTFVRSFDTPGNLLPRDANGTPNFVDDRGTIRTGRQDNRGFEGLSLSADGTKAYAMLQDPLVNEGRNPNNGNADGRFSRNLRIVEFDVASGAPERQFIYQLEPVAAINTLGDPDFAANQQGRGIGISAIQHLGGTKFLVLERDNRGVGTETSPLDTPLLKRAYVIDIANASDVANLSLAGTNDLPGGVSPVAKEQLPLVDLIAELRARGLPVPEKIEGMAFGEFLADGGRTLLFITDNDYSVTQNGGTVQFDVCFAPDYQSSVQVPIGAGCPTGSALLPTFMYSFKLSRDEYRDLVGLPAVPEPASWALMIGGMGAIGGTLRRRKAAIATA